VSDKILHIDFFQITTKKSLWKFQWKSLVTQRSYGRWRFTFTRKLKLWGCFWNWCQFVIDWYRQYVTKVPTATSKSWTDCYLSVEDFCAMKAAQEAAKAAKGRKK
jgi:hypothetical protein